MDRQQRTFNIVKSLNQFNNGEKSEANLLGDVCDYFDFIKNEEIDDADKKFLIHLSNKVGVPHYYDILENFIAEGNLKIADENISLNTFSSLLYESTLFTDSSSKLHRQQKEILDLFSTENRNRYFLSASTSFGKTHLVYEVIKKMKYKNIVLIFPSIALLTENLAKIKEGKITFNLDYDIHTLSDVSEHIGVNNIFIFTPERFLSFLDKNFTEIPIDFIFVDEVYKIDNGFIIDNEARENERDVAYRMSIFYGLSKYSNVDLLLAGPYIEIFDENSNSYNPSFDLFLNDFGITKLLKNEFEIVKVFKSEIEGIYGEIDIDGLQLNLKGKRTKKDRIQEILNRILLKNENAIVYCNTKSNAEIVADKFERAVINTDSFSAFIEHLKSKYHNDWIVIKALEKGIGVHHGVVPKYIQKEIINLFNQKDSGVDVLTSTTTITEGVNTTAKNMIVYKSEKGSGKNGKPLLTFDAKNIAGRAGRFMEHYKGRVISLDKEFIDRINESGHAIKHKNYDKETVKDEIDDEMTPPAYLDDRSRQRLQEVRQMQQDRKIPEEIISQFKVISRRDKIEMYDNIIKLTPLFLLRIKRFIGRLNAPVMRLDKDGFQLILGTCLPVIKNETLIGLIENKFVDNYTGNQYSILFAALNSYLSNGFYGVFNYYLKAERNKGNRNAVNSAMRQASGLVFNTFKYQLVKYLGIFNVMYRFIESQRRDLSFEDVTGIDKLLIKLEYNAFSEEARIASDYGVPQKIVDYYDSHSVEQSDRIFGSFDNYERLVFEKINRIIEN